MGSNMPLDSSTSALKSHLNAHAMPICGPNPWKPYLSHGKLMHHRASLEPRVLQMCSSSSFSFPVVPKPSSGAFIFIAIVIITILM